MKKPCTSKALSKSWWTLLQPIRTVSDIDFEIPVFSSDPFLYQQLSVEAKRLHLLGMKFKDIGAALGTDGKTAKKACLWRE